jgi:hypothetical protein
MTAEDRLQVIKDETARLQRYDKDQLIYLYTQLLVQSMEMAESMTQIAASLSGVVTTPD